MRSSLCAVVGLCTVTMPCRSFMIHKRAFVCLNGAAETTRHTMRRDVCCDTSRPVIDASWPVMCEAETCEVSKLLSTKGGGLSPVPQQKHGDPPLLSLV